MPAQQPAGWEQLLHFIISDCHLTCRRSASSAHPPQHRTWLQSRLHVLLPRVAVLASTSTCV